MPQNLLQKCLDILGLHDRPAPSVGEMVIRGGTRGCDLLLEVSSGRNAAPSYDRGIEESTPDVHRVSPATVFWGRDTPNPVGRLTQGRLPRPHLLEKTPLALLSEILGVAEGCGSLSDQWFARVGLELVAKDDNTCVGIRVDEAVEMRGTRGVGSRLGTGGSEEGPSGQRTSAGENRGSLPDGGERPTLPTPWPQRHRVAVPFQRVASRLVVNADHLSALRVLFLSGGVPVTDGCGLFGERLPVVTVWVLPGAASGWVERGVLVKSGSPAHGTASERYPWLSRPLSTPPRSSG
jgi:hypothetical protein